MLTVQNQAETTTQFHKFIGLANLKVVAVNPTMAEFKSLFGRELEKEPVYWDAVKQQRTVVFYYVGEELAIRANGKTEQLKIQGTHSVWLKNEAEVSKDGKTWVHIDNFGKHLHMTPETAKNIPVEWKMCPKSIRTAFKGEGDLIDFLKALAAPGQNDPFFVQNINMIIANGDVSVLKNLINSCNQNNNMIRVLLGIRTNDKGNKYQTIFQRCIERGTNNSTSYLWKTLVKNKDYTKDYFGDFNYSKEFPSPSDFALREYYDGMEGSIASSNVVAKPSFHNAFAAAGAVELPASMQGGAGNTFANNAAASSANVDYNMSNDDDDLPF